MNKNEAAVLFGRMMAVWPQLGGDDALAEQRAAEWLRILSQFDWGVGRDATDALIEDWTGAFPPPIGKWREVAVVLRKQRVPTELPALDGPAPDPDRLASLIEPVVRHLSVQKAAAAPRRERTELPADLSRHIASYDDLYGEEPNDEGSTE